MALGVLAMWVFLLVIVSAGLAGRVTGRAWRVLHRFAGVAWLLAWAHGVFAGSDTSSLLVLYVGSGIAVLTFNGATNLAYRVWTSTNFGNWQVLGVPTEVQPGRFMFADVGALANGRRFYRVSLP